MTARAAILMAVFAACAGRDPTTPDGPGATPPVVSVAQQLPSLFTGDTLQLLVLLSDADGNPLPDLSVQWTSSAPSVAPVHAGTGVVTGLTPGLARISASAAGGRGSTDIAILSRAVRPNRELAYLRVNYASSPSLDQVMLLNPADASTSALTAEVNAIVDFAWSPEGSRLALIYLPNTQTGQPRSGLWVQDIDGTGQRELNRFGVTPVWSPDGSSIVTVASVDGDLELFASASLSGSQQRLTNTVGDDYRPAFSPDGRRMAYVRDASELWLIGADGAGARPLHASTTLVGNPTWSPDGKWIAFYAGQDPRNRTTTAPGLWLIRPDGSGLHAVTANCGPITCSPDGTLGGWDWARDARRLFFGYAQGGGGKLIEVFADAPERRSMPTPGGCLADVTVSPDGQALALLCLNPAEATGARNVWIMGTDGSPARQLTHDQSVEHVRWRP